MTRRYSKPPTQRQLRVSEQIRQVLAEVLQSGDLHHPLLDNVLITIPEVRISPDLRIASAFTTIIPDNNEKAICALLNEAAPDIRKLITKKLKLQFSPEVRFINDDTIEQAAKMEEIFHKLEKSEEKDS